MPVVLQHTRRTPSHMRPEPQTVSRTGIVVQVRAHQPQEWSPRWSTMQILRSVTLLYTHAADGTTQIYKQPMARICNVSVLWVGMGLTVEPSARVRNSIRAAWNVGVGCTSW
jgi:hypothetical protein